MKHLHLAAERAHAEALAAARRAIRAGDLVAAERWMKLSERHWRNHAYAEAEWDKRRDERFARHRAREAARAKAKKP